MKRPAWSLVKQRGKRMLAPLFASFLCFLFAVIRPIAEAGGEYAFLCYTAVLIFFFPSGTTGAQLEATFLGVLFAANGMAWANVALVIASRCAAIYGEDSAQARAVLGLGLALMSFVGGWIRSYEPRLTMPTRIGLFFPIFHLTSRSWISSVTYRDFVDAFLVAAFAGCSALLANLLFSFHGAGPSMGSALIGTLGTMQQLLPLSLAATVGDSAPTTQDPHPRGTPNEAESQAALHLPSKRAVLGRQLRTQAAQLAPSLQAYVNEIVRARAKPSELGAIVKSIKAISRNPVLASPGHAPGERIRAALDRSNALSPLAGNVSADRSDTGARSRSRGRSTKARNPLPLWIKHERHQSTSTLASSADPGLVDSCNDLSQSVAAAWRQVEHILGEVFCWADISESRSERRDILHIQDGLYQHIETLERDLSSLLDMPDASGDRPARNGGERDDFRLAFYMTALLDLARDTLDLVQLAEKLQAGAGASRMYFPFPFWPLSLLHGEKSNPAPKPADELEEEKREAEEDGLEEDLRHLDFIRASLKRPRSTHEAPVSHRVRALWRRYWDHPRCLQARVLLSRAHHQARHSRHVLFALKLSGGISLLALPAFLPPGSAGREWFAEWRFAWAVVSYMYVLEVHTGAIFRVGFFRLTGTFIGAVAAYVNPYALVAVAMVCAVPITYTILFTSFPGVGTVAGITLPPLLFIRYLGLDEGQDEFRLAWTRFVDIAIGIIAAVIVGSLVWPDHARVRYFSVISSLLDRLNGYYLRMSRDNLRSSLVYVNDPTIYAALESALRQDLATARTLIAVQRDEISLLPRPVKLYSEVVDAAERLLDTMAEVRMLRFSVPRQETVLDVLPIRRELVSAVLINLWAIAQAFRSRSPLPQFLPSARAPLGEVMLVTEEQGRGIRRRTRSQAAEAAESPMGAGGRGHMRVSSADASRSRQSLDVGPGPKGAPSRTPSPAAPAAAQGARRDELAYLYAMAENEALSELCGIIDELVAAARTLFGTQTFLDTSVRQPREAAHMGQS